MDISTIKPVKTAIIGCGAISDIFFTNFTKRFKIIDLVKCYSRSGAEEKSEKYGVPVSSLEGILEDPEIELVVNLTPPSQHYAIIKAALEAGKHVFTEKVIAQDFDSIKELRDLANEKGLYLCSEPDHFMGSSWQCARQLIDGGIIGDVTSASVTISQNIGVTIDRARFVSEPAGGIGHDFGIYPVTHLVSLLGPAEEVCGIMTTQQPLRKHKEITSPVFGKESAYTNEDTVNAAILFKSGVTASLTILGNSVLEAPDQFTVFGSSGAISLPLAGLFSGDTKLYRAGSFEPVLFPSAHAFDHDSRGVGAAEMAWSIRLGRRPRAHADLGLHCFEIIDGIEKSFKTHQFYKLTTTVERPAPLPQGYRGIPGLSYNEEGSLVF